MGSIFDGQPVNASVTNASKLDRQTDDTAFGRITLANSTDPTSGSTVSNLQADINYGYQQDKLIFTIKNNGTLSWDGSQVSFSDDLQIIAKDYLVTNTVIKAFSPIVVTDGYSSYIILNRETSSNQVPSTVSNLPKGRDILRLWTRIGTSLILWDNTNVQIGQTIRIGASSSGGGSGTIKATYLDPVSTSLPTGSSYTVDGFSAANGDTVLFTNLSSNNNTIWMIQGVGTSITWIEQLVFNGGGTPTPGDAVRITNGTIYAEQLPVYDGTSFKINNVVRYFTGTNYFEVDAIQISTLSDNTTGNVFTVNFLNSENMVINYSLTRNGTSEIGTIYLKTDGTNTTVSTVGPNIGVTGVSFSSDISGSLVRLRYTTTSTGFSATMKYYLTRWSDGPGGPSGPPSYSGFAPAGAAGNNTDIQFNSAGSLGGDDSFTWDNSSKILQVNGTQFVGLQSTTLTDNVPTPSTFLTYLAASFRFSIFKVSVSRNGIYSLGHLYVVHDGTNVTVTSNFAITGATGVSFSGVISGSNVALQYTTTNTGFNATTKWSIERWN